MTAVSFSHKCRAVRNVAVLLGCKGRQRAQAGYGEKRLTVAVHVRLQWSFATLLLRGSILRRAGAR